MKPNSDIPSGFLHTGAVRGTWATVLHFQGVAQGPEARRPKAEAQQKVKVGSGLRSGKLRHLSRADGLLSWLQGGTCDWKGLPWPCPIATRFAVEEAEAQKGQVTCLRPHSLDLSFQSHRSL